MSQPPPDSGDETRQKAIAMIYRVGAFQEGFAKEEVSIEEFREFIIFARNSGKVDVGIEVFDKAIELIDESDHRSDSKSTENWLEIAREYYGSK